MFEQLGEFDAMEMWLDDLEEMGLSENEYGFLEWCRDNQIEPL